MASSHCDDWRNMPMLDQMQHLLDTGELSDCTFIVGGERISAHKLPLCRSSAVFQAMFTGELQEKGEITIPDVTANTFKIMLKYLYTDNVDLHNVKTCLQVMLIADKYLVTPLVNLCVDFVIDHMQPVDVINVFDVVDLIDNYKLRRACKEMLKYQTHEILYLTSWVNSSSKLVLTLLELNTLNVTSELPLLSACQQWVHHQVDNDDKLTLKEVAAPFLPHLRLRTLTTEQFTMSTFKYCIFTPEECMNILQCILKPKLSMPRGMCENTFPRMKSSNNDFINNPQSSRKKDLHKAVKDSLKNQQAEILIFSSEVNIVNSPSLIFHSNYYMLIHGVVYSPILFKSLSLIDRYIFRRYEYKEKLTVRLVDNDTDKCLTYLNYEDTVKYASKIEEEEFILNFRRPYLLKSFFKSVRLEVLYHTEVKGQRQFYGYSENEKTARLLGVVMKDSFIIKPNTGVYGISGILYKISLDY